MSDTTLEQLTAKYSLTKNEVKRLRGTLFLDTVDGPLVTTIHVSHLGRVIVNVADDWRFAKWLKRVRESSSNKDDRHAATTK